MYLRHCHPGLVHQGNHWFLLNPAKQARVKINVNNDKNNHQVYFERVTNNHYRLKL